MPDNILTQNSFIALTIVAEVEGNSDLGYAVVTILLPDTNDDSPVAGKKKFLNFSNKHPSTSLQLLQILKSRITAGTT